jgi:hypothetical protein
MSQAFQIPFVYLVCVATTHTFNQVLKEFFPFSVGVGGLCVKPEFSFDQDITVVLRINIVFDGPKLQNVLALPQSNANVPYPIGMKTLIPVEYLV